MDIITKQEADAYTAPGQFRRADSVEIDPVARRIVKINGRVVPEALHTEQMRAHVEAELGSTRYELVDGKLRVIEAGADAPIDGAALAEAEMQD